MEEKFHTINIEELFKTVSNFAIIEEIDKYLDVVDDKLEGIDQGGTIVFDGRAPIWLYCIVTNYTQQQRPDVIQYYSKPTTDGYRRFKIYPRE